MAENILHSGGFVDRNGNEITVIFYKKSSHAVMTVDPTALSFGNSAQTIRLKVYNSSGTLSVTKSAGATWLSYSGGSASGYKYYDVSVTANPNSYIRTAVLSLTDSYNTVTVNVSQAALISSISVNPDTLSFNSSGETKNATVTWEGGSTPTYTFSGSTPDWMSITNSVSGNQMTLTINAGPNTTGSDRNATMVITNGISTCTLEMTQGTVHQVSVSPSEFLNMAAAGETRTLTVSNIQGQVQFSYSGDGLSLGNPYISGQIALVSVIYAANTVAAARTGQVKVKDTNSDWVVIPTSQLASSAAFAVSPTSFEYAGSGSTNTFTFTGVPAGGMSYSIPAAAEDWVTISNFSNSSVDITTSANPYVTSRTTTVTFYDQDDPSNYVTVTVNQAAGQSSLTVSPTSITYMPSGGTYSVDVTWTAGNTPTATITYVQGAGGWLTQHSTTPSGGSMSFAWTATSNYDSSSRTALISITNGYQTEQVTVSQSSAPSPAVWTITPSSITGASASGNTYSITFANAPSSVDYSISYDSGNNWLGVSNLTSSGATVTVGANSDPSTRTATVLFLDDTDPTKYVSLSISQDGTVVPALSVQEVNMSFAAAGERKSNVVTNIVGTLTHTEPNWITVSESGSGGSRLIGVTAASNSSSAGRSGSLVFDDDRNNPVTVALSQEGLVLPLIMNPSSIATDHNLSTTGVRITYPTSGTIDASYDAAWVSLSRNTSSLVSYTFYVALSEYTPDNLPITSDTSRSTSITVTRGSRTGTLPVSQTATVMTVNPSNIAVSADRQAVTFEYTHWTYQLGSGVIASTLPSWITKSGPTAVGTSTIMTLNLSANTSTSDRTATITACEYKGNQIWSTTPVTITQEGATPVSSISVTPSRLDFSYINNASTLTVSGVPSGGFSTSISYITGASGWLSTTNTAYNIIVTASGTTYPSSRTATLTVTNASVPTDSVAIPITQAGNPQVLSVTPNAWTYPSSLGTHTFTVIYNASGTITPSVAYEREEGEVEIDWLEVELESHEEGSETWEYSIDVGPNNTGSGRSAMVTFTGDGGGADEVTVYQQP